MELARGVSSSELWILGLNKGRVGSYSFRTLFVSVYLFVSISLDDDNANANKVILSSAVNISDG